MLKRLYHAALICFILVGYAAAILGGIYAGAFLGYHISAYFSPALRELLFPLFCALGMFLGASSGVVIASMAQYVLTGASILDGMFR